MIACGALTIRWEQLRHRRYSFDVTDRVETRVTSPPVLTVRPPRAPRVSQAWFAAWLWMAITGLLALGSMRWLITLAVGAVGLVATEFAVWRSATRDALIVNGGELIRVSAFRRRAMQPSDIDRFVKVAVSVPGRRWNLLGWCLVIDRRERVCVKLDDFVWNEADVERVRKALRAPLVLEQDLLTFAELGRRYPGSVNYVYAHPWATAICACLALSLVAGALI